jgi:hypothetical protein
VLWAADKVFQFSGEYIFTARVQSAARPCARAGSRAAPRRLACGAAQARVRRRAGSRAAPHAYAWGRARGGVAGALRQQDPGVPRDQAAFAGGSHGGDPQPSAVCVRLAGRWVRSQNRRGVLWCARLRLRFRPRAAPRAQARVQRRARRLACSAARAGSRAAPRARVCVCASVGCVVLVQRNYCFGSV